MGFYRGPNIVTDGLIFAVDAGSERSYPGSGTTVSNIIDSSTGTLVNGVAFNSGNGGYWDFDGTDDYVNITNYTGHQSTTGTMEAWVKPDSTSGNVYAFGAGGGGTYGATRALRIASGNWGIVGYGSSTEDWNTGITATTNWQHVSIGWNGTTYYFYINGVRTSITRTGLVTPIGSALRIGCTPWSASSFINAKIASLKCYSNVLTEAQSLQNFNAQKSRFGL
jgi:hypothetical protein